ncbi:MAG: ATP-binding cassette domain-containing protein, partial [Burkholderiaceae bacterium]
GLFPHLSVLRNCMLAPMCLRGICKLEAEALALKHLIRLRMGAYAYKHPGQLSEGQQRRAAIARALCMMPKIMLFDEPATALGPEAAKDLLDAMTRLAEEGVAMLCVTREIGFARAAADRMIFLADGKIIEQASSRQFFSNPRQENTRNFLGQIPAS